MSSGFSRPSPHGWDFLDGRLLGKKYKEPAARSDSRASKTYVYRVEVDAADLVSAEGTLAALAR